MNIQISILKYEEAIDLVYMTPGGELLKKEIQELDGLYDLIQHHSCQNDYDTQKANLALRYINSLMKIKDINNRND